MTSLGAFVLQAVVVVVAKSRRGRQRGLLMVVMARPRPRPRTVGSDLAAFLKYKRRRAPADF